MAAAVAYALAVATVTIIRQTQAIYFTDIPGVGGWSDWRSWSACTGTCGGGQRARRRLCNNPPPDPEIEGAACEGDEKDYEDCSEVQPCGQWSLIKFVSE